MSVDGTADALKTILDTIEDQSSITPFASKETDYPGRQSTLVILSKAPIK